MLLNSSFLRDGRGVTVLLNSGFQRDGGMLTVL